MPWIDAPELPLADHPAIVAAASAESATPPKGRHRAPISRARLALLAATLVVGSAGTALASAAGWF